MRHAFVGTFLTIFALIWTAGVGAFDVALIWSISKQQQSKSWPTAPAIITRSEIVKTRGSKGGTNYRAAIEYNYIVENRPYHSDRHTFGMFDSTSSQQLAADVVASFPSGATVQARYNPANPAEATLATGLATTTLIAILFLTPFNCVLVGLWAYVVGWARRALTKPICGGLKLIESEGMTLIRVSWVSPLFAALACTGIAGFISIFVVGILTRRTGSWTSAIVALALAYGLGLCTWLFVYLFGARWDKFIIIEPAAATITVPPLGSGSTENTLRFDEIRDIDQHSVTRGKSTTTYLRIHHASDDAGPHERQWPVSMGTDRLAGLIAYLRDRVGLARPQ